MPKAYIIHDSGYQIEDISPVPTGTDIIENPRSQERGFFMSFVSEKNWLKTEFIF